MNDKGSVKYKFDITKVNKFLELYNIFDNSDDTRYSLESVTELFNAVIDCFTSSKKITVDSGGLKEDTEEDAENYFGSDFINDFNNLMSVLDKQNTIVKMHGTFLENCDKICNEGLFYELPQLARTTVDVDIPYCQENIEYHDFKKMKNWPHKNYKGLVILAIPYECYYKEGIWNHFDKMDNNQFSYKINPDFIVGYVDVENKKIKINPKYNREHNYEGLTTDIGFFKRKLDWDNFKEREFFKNKFVEFNAVKDTETKDFKINSERDAFDIIESRFEVIKGHISAISLYNDCIVKENYADEFKTFYEDIIKTLPLLKTKKEMIQEKQKIESNQQNNSFDDDIDDNFFESEVWAKDYWDIDSLDSDGSKKI